jgi:hypothetical protein
MEYLLNNQTELIIKALYRVYNTLGFGFLEKVYKQSMIIELKAAACICDEHEAQMVNYLKATNIEIDLLMNFGKRPVIKRKIFSNDRK